MAGVNGHPRNAPRTIREEHAFRTQASGIIPDPIELDRILDPIKHVIARIPEMFHNIPGTRYCAADYTGNPHVRVWFMYDEQYVDLLGIERLDDQG